MKSANSMPINPVGTTTNDDGEPAPLAPGESTSPRMRKPAGVKRILVVDDEPDAVESIAAILREDGYLVDTAATAEEALDRFRAETYHLLLTDLFLPGKSGVDLTKVVHEGCPATAIVLVTGHATVKSAVVYPRRLTVTVVMARAEDSENVPESDVVVARGDPTTRTRAPATGAPDCRSTTVPRSTTCA